MATVSYGSVRVICRASQVPTIAAQLASQVGRWQTLAAAFSWDDAFFVLHALEARRRCSLDELCAEVIWSPEPTRKQRGHVLSVIRDIQRTCCRFGLPAYALVSMTAERGKLVYLAGWQLDEFLQTLDQVAADRESLLSQ